MTARRSVNRVMCFKCTQTVLTLILRSINRVRIFMHILLYTHKDKLSCELKNVHGCEMLSRDYQGRNEGMDILGGYEAWQPGKMFPINEINLWVLRVFYHKVIRFVLVSPGDMTSKRRTRAKSKITFLIKEQIQPPPFSLS